MKHCKSIWWIFEKNSQQISISFEQSKLAIILEYFSKQFGHVPQFSNLNPLYGRGDPFFTIYYLVCTRLCVKPIFWVRQTKFQYQDQVPCEKCNCYVADYCPEYVCSVQEPAAPSMTFPCNHSHGSKSQYGCVHNSCNELSSKPLVAKPHLGSITVY